MTQTPREPASWIAAAVLVVAVSSPGCRDDDGASDGDTESGGSASEPGGGGSTDDAGSSDAGSSSEEETSSTTSELLDCGDGVTDPGEECDDGNNDNNDGCDADCQSTRVIQVSAGALHTCAVLRSGSLRCWGWGLYGQLGYGNGADVGDDETPADVGDVDVGGSVVQVSTGSDRTCALLEGGTVRCWGADGNGALGYGNTEHVGDDETPASVGDVDVGGTVIEVSTSRVTCALMEGGGVRCWGDGGDAGLGYGNTDVIGDDDVPADVGEIDVGGPVAQILSKSAVYAVMEGGGVRSWGNGTFGRLGYGDTEHVGDDEIPADVGDVDVDGTVTHVAAGVGHACVLLEGGTVRCWGNADRGQLGYGNTDSVGDTPDRLPSAFGPVDIGGTVVALSSHNRSTCALMEGGTLRCWGDGEDGQLGYGNTDIVGDDEVPADVGDVPLGETVVQVAAGGAHTCALLEQGTVRCWGRAEHGQLGQGNTTQTGHTPDTLPEVMDDVPIW